MIDPIPGTVGAIIGAILFLSSTYGLVLSYIAHRKLAEANRRNASERREVELARLNRQAELDIQLRRGKQAQMIRHQKAMISFDALEDVADDVERHPTLGRETATALANRIRSAAKTIKEVL